MLSQKKKIIFLTPFLLLLMGNQKSCEKAPAVQTRELKKIVEIEKIVSRPVNLGAGGTFDFEFVVNQQIYTVLLDSDQFAFRIQPPVSFSPSPMTVQKATGSVEYGSFKTTSDSMYMTINTKDKALMQNWLGKASEKPPQIATESQEAWCMVNNPQATLTGSVNSFEMLGSGGVTLGFTPSGNHTVSLSLVDVFVEFFQLDLSLHALNPLTSTALGSANVTSKQTNTKVSFGLQLGPVNIGPSIYYKLPLATVTKKALVKAVEDLKKDLEKKEWYTRVLANKDNDLVLVGGTNVNLKPGDELAVYNETYFWSGKPCESQLSYEGISVQPVAKGVVTHVGEELSILTLKDINQDSQRVQIGAKVRLLRKVEDIPPAAPANKK